MPPRWELSLNHCLPGEANASYSLLIPTWHLEYLEYLSVCSLGCYFFHLHNKKGNGCYLNFLNARKRILEAKKSCQDQCGTSIRSKDFLTSRV